MKPLAKDATITIGVKPAVATAFWYAYGKRYSSLKIHSAVVILDHHAIVDGSIEDVAYAISILSEHDD